MNSFLSKKLAEATTPYQAKLLADELSLHTYADLLYHFPFRYEDRTRFHTIDKIDTSLLSVQCKGYLGPFQFKKHKYKTLLTAPFRDDTGTITLVWFNGVQWIPKKIRPNMAYIMVGRPSRYQKKQVVIHPELTPLLLNSAAQHQVAFQPVYASTTKLTRAGLETRGLARLQKKVLQAAKTHIQEIFPAAFLQHHQLMPRAQAIQHIHFPANKEMLAKAQVRFKFEEIFFLHLRIQKTTRWATEKIPGAVFKDTKLVHQFYTHLPFSLTNAQKKAVKEIYHDLQSGAQMNRLLQGDVGCGKTIIAFISMLIPLAEGAQVAFMAPTEILAQQHFQTLEGYTKGLGLSIAILTGSTKQKARKQIYAELSTGELQILVGTHALLEDKVQFHKLGLVTIDEQQRFGVAQRGKLWQKNTLTPPHVLIMTATPIPRTLSMTFYSHLAITTVDELPPNRKPVKTYYAYDAQRLRLFGFMREKIAEGRQVYIVYPRIESSKDESHKYLIDGYDSICRAFPHVPVSILHGRMKPANKAYEMARFVHGETKIMVATTVIEVGVNVPNATVMVIENAESFGLAQLHQIRGRIVRGNEQPYCILMTKNKLNKTSKARIDALVKTHNGFDIAEIDLKLRGGGDIDGVAQSGLPNFKLVNFTEDRYIIMQASKAVKALLATDPHLRQPQHAALRAHLGWLAHSQESWIQIG